MSRRSAAEDSGLGKSSLSRPLTTYPQEVVELLAPKKQSTGTLKKPVELQGTVQGDRLLVVVSTAKYYFRSPSYLQGITTRLVARHSARERIAGLSKKSQQHEIRSGTFLVAGHLQRRTLFIKELADILRFRESIKQLLIDDNAAWRFLVDKELKKELPESTNAKAWDLRRHDSLEALRPKVVGAVERVQARITEFETEIQTKQGEGGATGWESEVVKGQIKLLEGAEPPEGSEVAETVARLQSQVITAITRGEEWHSIYERGMYELLCSDDAKFVFSEADSWVDIYQSEIFELCSKNARAEGDEWVVLYKDVVTNPDSKTPLLLDEDSDRSVLYRPGEESGERELDIIRWEEKTDTEEYKEKLHCVKEAYGENKAGFKTIVDEAAESYLAWFSQQRRNRFPKDTEEIHKDFFEEAWRQSIEYILEESAVFWMFIEEGKHDGFAYPFEENETNGSLYQCILKLNQLMNAEKAKNNEMGVRMRPVSLIFASRAPVPVTRPQPQMSEHFSEDSLMMMKSIMLMKDGPEKHKALTILHMVLQLRMQEEGHQQQRDRSDSSSTSGEEEISALAPRVVAVKVGKTEVEPPVGGQDDHSLLEVVHPSSSTSLDEGGSASTAEGLSGSNNRLFAPAAAANDEVKEVAGVGTETNEVASP